MPDMGDVLRVKDPNGDWRHRKRPTAPTPNRSEEGAARGEEHRGNERIVKTSGPQRPRRYVGRTRITGQADTRRQAQSAAYAYA